MGSPDSDLHHYLKQEDKYQRGQDALEKAEIELREELEVSVHLDAQAPAGEQWYWSIGEKGKPDTCWGDDYAATREQAMQDADAHFASLAEDRVKEWKDQADDDRAEQHFYNRGN